MPKYIVFIVVAAFIAFSVQAKNAASNSHDSTKPVEITADSLEVIQEQNKAIFTGDVQAKQGDIDIRAERMTVFYKKDAPNESVKTSDSGSKVSRVEIERNVFISTPKETAQGNKGVYNVDSGIITLEGDVSLSSGKNIVKGEKLVYNLKTGQSKMVSGTSVNAGNGKKQRVRGVFVPGGSQ